MTNETKRPAIAVTVEGITITFDVAEVGRLQLNVLNLSREIRDRAMMHGLEQKIRDAAAIGYTQPDGSVKRPTNRQKYEAMREVINTLTDGNWNKRREGSAADGGLLFEALCRMYEGKREPAELREWLADKDEKTKAALRRNPKVAGIIAIIRAERNPDAADVVESLLDDLNAA